jgi:N-acetylmuramoyl-L-alanine amidase
MSILQQMFTAGMADYGNVGNFNFLLNQPTDFPNSLLEIGFLSNVDDEKNILNPQFQHTTAVKIYEGILDFLRQCQ